MLSSNSDCAFHPTDDTLKVQGWLDNNTGQGPIYGHTLHISDQIIFRHALTQFDMCKIYITKALIDRKPWYASAVPAGVHRFVNCDIAFGKDVYHYSGTGSPKFVEKLK
jgi:hypothetical protein